MDLGKISKNIQKVIKTQARDNEFGTVKTYTVRSVDIQGKITKTGTDDLIICSNAMTEWTGFRHYSPNEIQLIYHSEHDINFKPRGMYFSRGDAWWDWTMNAGYSPNIYTHKYDFDPNTPPLNILKIDEQNVFAIHQQYQDDFSFFASLNWPQIAETFDGVYIGEKLIQSNDRKLLVYHGYDVETLVVWSSKLQIIDAGPVLYPDYQFLDGEES